MMQESEMWLKRARADAGQGCLRNLSFVKIFVLCIFFSIFLQSYANAKNTTVISNLDFLKSYYFNQAFENPNRKLSKFSKAGPLTLQLKCAVLLKENCQNLIIGSRFQTSFKTSDRITFTVSEADLNPDVQLIFADNAYINIVHDKLSSSNGYHDASVPNCQLFLSLAGDEIKNIKILVLVQTSESFQMRCFGAAMFRGLGLSQYNHQKISVFWNSADINGGTDADGGDLGGLLQSFSVLEYLHMCPLLKPSMSFDEVKMIMNEKTGCISGLQPTK
jgi:hypothetical protein